MPKVLRNTQTKGFFSSTIFLVGSIILLFMFALGFWRMYYQGSKVRQQISSLQEKMNGLEKQKLESIKTLSYVMSNDFVEEKARTELNLKKLDEKVIIFNGVEADVEKKKTHSFELNDTRQTVTNPIKWWYYFFDRQNGKKLFNINN